MAPNMKEIQLCVCASVLSAGSSSRCGLSVQGWSRAGSETDGRSKEELKSARDVRSPQIRSLAWGYLDERKERFYNYLKLFIVLQN